MNTFQAVVLILSGLLLVTSLLGLYRNELVFRCRTRWGDELSEDVRRCIDEHFDEQRRRIDVGLPTEPYLLSGVNSHAESDRRFGTYEEMLYRRLGSWWYRDFYPVTPREYLDELVREKGKGATS